MIGSKIKHSKCHSLKRASKWRLTRRYQNAPLPRILRPKLEYQNCSSKKGHMTRSLSPSINPICHNSVIVDSINSRKHLTRRKCYHLIRTAKTSMQVRPEKEKNPFGREGFGIRWEPYMNKEAVMTSPIASMNTDSVGYHEIGTVTGDWSLSLHCMYKSRNGTKRWTEK